MEYKPSHMGQLTEVSIEEANPVHTGDSAAGDGLCYLWHFPWCLKRVKLYTFHIVGFYYRRAAYQVSVSTIGNIGTSVMEKEIPYIKWNRCYRRCSIMRLFMQMNGLRHHCFSSLQRVCISLCTGGIINGEIASSPGMIPMRLYLN